MCMTDPIGDMLTRIRNGQRAKMKSVVSPASKLREGVLNVLLQEGYIRSFKVKNVRKGLDELVIELKYFDEQPVIKSIQRVSKPGRRVYTQIKELPKVCNGLGISILSTPKGVLSNNQAQGQNVGGEVLCTVY